MRFGVSIVGLLLLTACSVTEPGSQRVLGTIIGFDENDPQITVSADGSRVTATIATYGNGCYSVAETDVEVSGRTATITPFDRDPGCLQRDLKVLEHVVRIEFPSAGTATIRVKGLDKSNLGAADLDPDTVVVERSVDLQ